jgi:PAS domain S-box-containing protein
MSAGGETSRAADHIVSPAALLEAFAETSDDAMISLDGRGTIISWNHAAERFFGYRSDEIVGASFAALFPDRVSAEIEAVFETVIAGDRVKRYDTEVLRNDGMPMPISLSLSPVLDAGVPVALVLIALDITEQRLAQATLAEVEARVRESEALAHVGSWLWDLRTGAVQWSDEYYRINGVDPRDFGGTFESQLATIHPGDRERVSQAMLDAVATARPFDEEYRIVRPDGDVRIVHARAQPSVGSAGTSLGLRGIGQDVTDRRAADLARADG